MSSHPYCYHWHCVRLHSIMLWLATGNKVSSLRLHTLPVCLKCCPGLRMKQKNLWKRSHIFIQCPQFAPKIITNAFNLDQHWQFHHKNDKNSNFLHFCPPPFPQKKKEKKMMLVTPLWKNKVHHTCLMVGFIPPYIWWMDGT